MMKTQDILNEIALLQQQNKMDIEQVKSLTPHMQACTTHEEQLKILAVYAALNGAIATRALHITVLQRGL
jgi:hypothetical protein